VWIFFADYMSMLRLHCSLKILPKTCGSTFTDSIVLALSQEFFGLVCWQSLLSSLVICRTSNWAQLTYTFAWILKYMVCCIMFNLYLGDQCHVWSSLPPSVFDCKLFTAFRRHLLFLPTASQLQMRSNFGAI